MDALPELSRRGGSTRAVRIATVADAEREIETARRFGARFVGIGEPDYPPALRQIDAAPPLISAKGDLGVATLPAVGIVGSRNASISGTKFAAMMARDIGRAGYAVVSGLARGIDAAAHQASLETGTIAAMAGGSTSPIHRRTSISSSRSPVGAVSPFRKCRSAGNHGRATFLAATA